MLQAWKKFYVRYERLLLAAFLLFGFFLHFFTFKHIEIHLTFIGLGVYALVAAMSIVYIHAFDAHRERLKHAAFERARLIAPLITQLALGSLLSMAFLFYWFSGELIACWPVFVILVATILLNEAFRNAHELPTAQMSVFSYVLFSYCTLLFPYLFNSLSQTIFFLGGGVSLMLSLLVVGFLWRWAPPLRMRIRQMIAAVLAVFVVMNVLYFLNMIPPIPLSLREAGVYHNVARVGGAYTLDGESETWWQKFLPGQTLHQDATGRVYVYSAVYAPADLTTKIFHRWEKYDAKTGRWINVDRVSFAIVGGRIDGYRGYTFENHLALGRWRVTIETERGQVLGRIPFTYVAKE